VATRHSQKPGIDYNDTFAPVGDKVILRFVLSFALHLGYKLFQLGIETAYLYGNLKENINMIQPEGFDDGAGRVIYFKSASMASNNREENSTFGSQIS
jgi:hypothetical protein